MRAYLDASVILPTLVEERTSALVESFLATAAEELVLSEFAAAEVASAVSRLIRIRNLDGDNAAARLVEFDTWRAGATADIDIRTSDLRLATGLVRRFELMLRAPDALHLAICRRADCRLITLDRRLARAAQALDVPARLLE